MPRENVVRTIVIDDTEFLFKDQLVENTEYPNNLSVSSETSERTMNITGESIDKNISIVTKSDSSNHTEAPEVVEMNVSQTNLESGIKDVDLPALHTMEGKTG